jgi:tRNA (uracil-5-)-methyltransferase TRM9
MVPWVLSKELSSPKQGEAQSESEAPQVFNRYYHMFAKGELRQLVEEACSELELQVEPVGANAEHQSGVEVVQDGWERSNYYVELRRWHV